MLQRLPSFDVEKAWEVFIGTRKPEIYDPANIRAKKMALQTSLEQYIQAVNKDFGIDIANINRPKDFITERHFTSKDLEKIPNAQWYSSLERMRAYELKKSFEKSLEGVEPPKTESKNLTITDVGSRSNFFGSLMSHENKEQKWQLVDIKDHKLPARAKADGLFHEIEAFSELPKSDIITLNSVLHHVGECEHGSGIYDDSKIGIFIEKVRNALPEDGLVIVTEDYIGKDTAEKPYNNFIKGMDDLFYPQSLGNQKSVKEWINIFQNNGLTLEKELHPIVFNIIGFPVVESCLVFRKNMKTGINGNEE